MMRLTALYLSHFRCYEDKRVSLSPKLTMFIGPNTSGKTSLFEAIVLLSTGRSFRADVQKEMIKKDKKVARIKGVCGKETIEVVVTPGEVMGKKTPKKSFFLNGVTKRSIDFIGNLPTVLFWPEDLRLITGSPSRRRRYLDSVLSQADRAYRRSMRAYEKALRIRNKLLQSSVNGYRFRPDEMSYFEGQLIEHGNIITKKREEYLQKGNVMKIRGCEIEHFYTTYEKSAISSSELEKHRRREQQVGVTMIGPHRDDFTINKNRGNNNHTDIKKFGSRGEQRLGVLWLKLIELSFLENVFGFRPLLLLDDILSELDDGYRKLVLDIVGNQQTILATADMRSVPGKIRRKAELILLNSNNKT